MASNIKITLEIEGKSYVLPILPPSIEVSSPSGNESADVIKLGEITIPKKRRLRTLTIDSFLPFSSTAFPFCMTRDSFMYPKEYITAFDKAQTEGTPARLTVEGCGLNAFYVTIEDFSYTFGRDRNIEYSLSLKEFRPYGQRGKTMEVYSDVFNEDESVEMTTNYGGIRQPGDYAIGDRVIVNGAYWASQTGLKPPISGLTNFATEPLTPALYELWRNRKQLDGNVLSGQRCIIIDKEMDKTKTYDLPIMGDVDVPIPIPFRYHVADLDTRKAIGWVSGTQMERID